MSLHACQWSGGGHGDLMEQQVLPQGFMADIFYCGDCVDLYVDGFSQATVGGGYFAFVDSLCDCLSDFVSAIQIQKSKSGMSQMQRCIWFSPRCFAVRLNAVLCDFYAVKCLSLFLRVLRQTQHLLSLLRAEGNDISPCLCPLFCFDFLQPCRDRPRSLANDSDRSLVVENLS